MKKHDKLFKKTMTIGLIVLMMLSWGELMVQGKAYSASIYELVSLGDAIEMTGEDNGDGAASGVAGIGDINNDGYDDFITGAWQSNSATGKAYIILGRENWESFSLGEADQIIIGDDPASTFGGIISALGDVDGDDSPDFSVSAMWADDAGSDSGEFFVFSSKDMSSWGNPSSASDVALASFLGESPGDWAGHGSHGVGDVNNDGYDDFLVASEKNTRGGTDAGKVYLVYGRQPDKWALDVSLSQVNSSFYSSSPGAFLGMDTGHIGDINNDGYNDFIIGSVPTIDGIQRRVAYIFFGQEERWEKNTPISQANVTIAFGEVSSLFSAKWLSGNVDVNNDGYDDVLIGSYTDDPLGKTYLLLGRATNEWSHTMDSGDMDASFTGTSTVVRTGYAVSGLGDINNDGNDEIITSEFTPQLQTKENYVHIMLGRPTDEWDLDMSLSDAYMTISSGLDTGDTTNNEAFGNTVMDVGDVDNNGIPDFAINRWQSDKGTLYLVLNGFVPTTSKDTDTNSADVGYIMLLLCVFTMTCISTLRRRKKI